MSYADMVSINVYVYLGSMVMNFSTKLFCTSLAAVLFLLLLLVARSNLTRGALDAPALMMYCAAGVKPPVLKAAREFERRYGVKVDLQYGGSGTLLNNLQIAKQGDLYLAADVSFLEIAREKGLVRESLPLAQMKPVLAVQKGNPKNIKNLRDLLRRDVRLSLGNPETASIGKQTELLLSKAGLWEDIVKHVERSGVFKPTVPDVANDVKLGAVDAGIVWDATVNQYNCLLAIPVPEFDRAEKMISIGILESSQQATLALHFARFLNSEVGNQIFNTEGYRAVKGGRWDWTPELTFLWFSKPSLCGRNFEKFSRTRASCFQYSLQ